MARLSGRCGRPSMGVSKLLALIFDALLTLTIVPLLSSRMRDCSLCSQEISTGTVLQRKRRGPKFDTGNVDPYRKILNRLEEFSGPNVFCHS
jgi:hypothetical protein